MFKKMLLGDIIVLSIGLMLLYGAERTDQNWPVYIGIFIIVVILRKGISRWFAEVDRTVYSHPYKTQISVVLIVLVSVLATYNESNIFVVVAMYSFLELMNTYFFYRFFPTTNEKSERLSDSN